LTPQLSGQRQQNHEDVPKALVFYGSGRLGSGAADCRVGGTASVSWLHNPVSRRAALLDIQLRTVGPGFVEDQRCEAALLLLVAKRCSGSAGGSPCEILTGPPLW
jgi:hypothetical protein